MTDEERKTDAKKAYDALMRFYPFTLENLDGEQWADIPNYEGRYQVSTFGRVKSNMKAEEKILRPGVNHKGYLMVRLYKDHKGKTFLVNRLVAILFSPNPELKPEVNHEDGHKLNNHVSNLTWVTRLENSKHANKHGLINYLSGEQHGNAKLTNEQASWCREVFVSGDKNFGIAALARKLNLSEDIVRRCVHGRTYKKSVGIIHMPQVVKAKCPDEIADKIFAEYKAGGISQQQLAVKYGYNFKTIFRIVHEK